MATIVDDPPIGYSSIGLAHLFYMTISNMMVEIIATGQPWQVRLFMFTNNNIRCNVTQVTTTIYFGFQILCI